MKDKTQEKQNGETKKHDVYMCYRRQGRSTSEKMDSSIYSQTTNHF